MKWRDLLGNWGVNKLQLKAGFLEAEFVAQDVDRNAAWELYVELATRISTQPLPHDQGVDKAALSSLHSLFGTTREILKKHGPSASRFAPLAIAVLNDVLRPFLTRWHAQFEAGLPLGDADHRKFRSEVEAIRQDMLQYADLLARIAAVDNHA